MHCNTPSVGIDLWSCHVPPRRAGAAGPLGVSPPRRSLPRPRNSIMDGAASCTTSRVPTLTHAFANTSALENPNRAMCIRCGGSDILQTDGGLRCPGCGAAYPVVGGHPVFLTDGIFSSSDLSVAGSGFSTGLVARVGRVLPRMTWLTPEARSLVRRSVSGLRGRKSLCVVIGCGETPLRDELSDFDEVVFTDVVVSPLASIVCDGHELPFKSDSVDTVIVTAVLEHVLSPERVVSEICRVLRPAGLVVAATPFIAQVHMGAYDFQRFTDLGHRWLFRKFHEIERGVTSAAGTALLWSIEYFVRAFFRSRVLANALAGVVRISLFWLKYFDAVLYQKPGAYDSGAGYYFVGANAKRDVITARELIAEYRGMKR